MLSVLVLRHGDDIPAGYLAEALDRAGAHRREVLLHRGEPIPDDGEWRAVAVLGGTMGAYDDDVHSWLAQEKRFLDEQIRRGVPVLGICLGSQVLADVLGGRAFLSDRAPELGHLLPELTAAGRADPVLHHLDAAMPVWHQDTWELPPGATLLAATAGYPHAFRLGSTVAIQAHPEADATVVERWASHPGTAPIVAAAGVDAAELVDAVRSGADLQRDMALRLFGARIDEVVGRG